MTWDVCDDSGLFQHRMASSSLSHRASTEHHDVRPGAKLRASKLSLTSATAFGDVRVLWVHMMRFALQGISDRFG